MPFVTRNHARIQNPHAERCIEVNTGTNTSVHVFTTLCGVPKSSGIHSFNFSLCMNELCLPGTSFFLCPWYRGGKEFIIITQYTHLTTNLLFPLIFRDFRIRLIAALVKVISLHNNKQQHRANIKTKQTVSQQPERI